MKTKYKILLIIAPAVFLLDLFTKFIVMSYYEVGMRIPVINGFFDLVHFRNTGAAFGMFSGMNDSFRIPFFYVIAIVAVILLVFFYRSIKDNEKIMAVAISLVFGGIAGNISDRIRFGSVVDFLSFHVGSGDMEFYGFHVPLEWPAFNVADSAITVAMFLLLYSAFKGKPDANLE